MKLSPQLIEQRHKSGFQYSTSIWQQASRNSVGIWDLASIKLIREVFSLVFFKVTHFYQTHNDTHDLTDDNYSMSTSRCTLKSRCRFITTPLFVRISGTPCPPTFACSSYISRQTFQEVASQASRKSSCLSRPGPCFSARFSAVTCKPEQHS